MIITHKYFDIFTKRQISVFVFNFDPYSTNWLLTCKVKIMIRVNSKKCRIFYTQISYFHYFFFFYTSKWTTKITKNSFIKIPSQPWNQSHR